MKQIIGGLLYDTETATQVCDVTSPDAFRDPRSYHYEDTRLYQTRKGAFFTAGEGGALTRYSESLPNGGRTGGSGLSPVAREEAKQLVAQHATPDVYSRLFESFEEA